MHHFSERADSSSTESSLDLNSMLSLSEVQRQCLLHVLLKVMEGVLSHVRKAKAYGLVAQHEVRLLLRVLLHKIVRVLPFTPLKVFSFHSWKSMMCVRRLSKKAVACEVQVMLP